MSGTLVTVEGIDGSGTSTVTDALSQAFPEVEQTTEPTDYWTGAILQKSLSDERVTRSELSQFFLFLADRAEHLERRVRPSLERGKTVLCDRYVDSTRAYQPALLAEGDHYHSQIQAKVFVEEAMADWLVEPDCTIWLDCPVDVALDRVTDDHYYEQRELLERVAENYRAMNESFARFHRVDATQSEQDVIDDAKDVLDGVR